MTEKPPAPFIAYFLLKDRHRKMFGLYSGGGDILAIGVDENFNENEEATYRVIDEIAEYLGVHPFNMELKKWNENTAPLAITKKIFWGTQEEEREIEKISLRLIRLGEYVIKCEGVTIQMDKAVWTIVDEDDPEAEGFYRMNSCFL